MKFQELILMAVLVPTTGCASIAGRIYQSSLEQPNGHIDFQGSSIATYTTPAAGTPRAVVLLLDGTPPGGLGILQKKLPERGFTSVIIDRPGWRNSEGSVVPASQIHLLLQALAAPYVSKSLPVLALGWSDGAAFLTDPSLASQAGLSGFVLIAPRTGRFNDEIPWVGDKLASPLFYLGFEVFGPIFAGGIARRQLESALAPASLDDNSVAGFAREVIRGSRTVAFNEALTTDSREAIEAVKYLDQLDASGAPAGSLDLGVRALVIYGLQDAALPADQHVARLEHLLTNATFKSVPDAGHALVMTHADLVADFINDWF